MSSYLSVLRSAFFIAFSIWISTANAQLVLRPMVGVNSSKFTTDFNDEQFKSQLGYQFGADLMIGGRLYVAPGVLFEVVKKEVTQGNDTPAGIQLTRLNVPLHVGFKFFDAGVDRTFDIRIFAGPNMALNLGKDVDVNDVFDEDQIKNADWGWDVGVGIDFLIAFVDVGYRFGLSEVFEGEVENSSRNDVFTANAGIRIRF